MEPEEMLEEVRARLSDAIQSAASNGRTEVLTALLSILTDIRINTLALQGAAENGHVECIGQLIPVSDPKDKESLSLQWAAFNGHVECTRLLIPVSDPEAAKESLKRANDAHGAIDLIDSILQMEALNTKHLANGSMKPNRAHI